MPIIFAKNFGILVFYIDFCYDTFMSYEGNEYPFRESPVEKEVSGKPSRKIKSLPGVDKFIIREESLSNQYAEDPKEPGVEESLSWFRNVKEVFDRMRSFGISVPEFRLVYGKGENNERRMFMVVDEIQGEPFSELDSLPEIARQKCETFLNNFLSFLEDAYKNKKQYYLDFHSHHLMWGHSKREQTDNLYIVDVGPESITNSGEPNDTFSDDLFYNFLGKLSSDIESIEMMFKPKADFGEIKKKINKLREEISG